MTDRRLEKRVELDATPEQVWEAIATGPGISAWFVPHEIADDGTVTQRFGAGFDATATVTAREEGSRFALAADNPDGMPSQAFEFLVEGRDGGGAVLRFVQSGFLDEPGWETEYNSFDTGWDLFFHNLRAYLEHFAGQPVHNVVTVAYTPADRATAWPVLHRALGIDGHPAVGTEITLTPDGIAPITGVVDAAGAEFLGIRSEHGLHRIGAEGDAGCGVSAYHYFYGEPVDVDALTAAWQGWLERLFPVAV
ncbi:SRPBCC family protein [Pseudonocardia sp. GCM10023141]|uniref:SRPBCC family protein n=1 Tax=Pseudonocardia sp. GCM10023141 TaxID=3252653 RepID=UPI0036161137